MFIKLFLHVSKDEQRRRGRPEAPEANLLGWIEPEYLPRRFGVIPEWGLALCGESAKECLEKAATVQRTEWLLPKRG
jgi:hypothetical protein